MRYPFAAIFYFQCELVHIYSTIALKASFTILIPVVSSRDGISPSVPLPIG